MYYIVQPLWVYSFKFVSRCVNIGKIIWGHLWDKHTLTLNIICNRNTRWCTTMHNCVETVCEYIHVLWPIDILVMHAPTKPRVQLKKLKCNFWTTGQKCSSSIRYEVLSFSVRGQVFISTQVCVLVYTSGQAGRPVHSCLRGMRPGREPHRNNNNPHQRSSIGGTWLSTFILWVYESSLCQSITHRHGEGREKRRWFAKYKLTTNWSLTHAFILFFFLLLTIFLLSV